MKFDEITNMFCGISCATAYCARDSCGMCLRFDKPYLPQEHRKVKEVITSLGTIYMKFKMCDSKTRSTSDVLETYGVRVPSAIEHYTCTQITGSGISDKAQVGMCLFIDYAPYYDKISEQTSRECDKAQYKRSAEIYRKEQKKIDDTLEGVLLYKSEPFWNTMHSERTYPSCILYIYDKEMKHEI